MSHFTCQKIFFTTWVIRLFTSIFFIIFLIQQIFLAQEIAARSFPQKPSPKVAPLIEKIHIYESNRKASFLPFLNESKSPSSAYPSYSLPTVLSEKISNIGYVSVTHPAKIMSVSSATHSSKASGSLKKSTPPKKEKFKRLRLDVQMQKLPLPKVRKLLNQGLPIASSQLDSDYLIYGIFSSATPKSKWLICKLYFYNAINSSSQSISLKLERKYFYNQLDKIVKWLETILLGKNSVLFSVKTSVSGAMVYLDHIYLGRTPTQKKVIPGKYNLRVIQENYKRLEQDIIINSKRKKLQIQSTPEKNTSALIVESKPSGSSIYFNSQYIGKTPLKKENLPQGTHHVRLSYDGYVDTFIGVNLHPSREEKISLSLRKGETESFYAKKQYVFGKTSYLDLSWYSYLSAFGFYAGWIILGAQAGRELDRNSLEKSQQYRLASNISGGLGISFLVLSGIFLFLAAFNSSSTKFGETSLIQKQRDYGDRRIYANSVYTKQILSSFTEGKSRNFLEFTLPL